MILHATNVEKPAILHVIVKMRKMTVVLPVFLAIGVVKKAIWLKTVRAVLKHVIIVRSLGTKLVNVAKSFK